MGAVAGPRTLRSVGKLALHELELWMQTCSVQVGGDARRKIVDAAHPVPGRKQPITKVAANEPGCAGDEDQRGVIHDRSKAGACGAVQTGELDAARQAGLNSDNGVLVSNPLVSVVIPTFNRAGRLHVSVESVIAQTYRPIELVVIDDGGSDDTPKVFPELEQKAREAGLKTVFERKDNDGCASARNLAMERATGEMIAFLDDDDRWLPDKLAKQVQCMQETGADASCCQTRKLIQRGEIIQPPTPDRLVQGREPGRYIDGRSDAHLITIVLSKALLPKVGTFDTTLRVSSDTEWIARLVHVAEFCAVPEVLAVYEWNPQALSRIDDLQAELKRDEVRLRQLRLIRERCTNLPGWDEAHLKLGPTHHFTPLRTE
jgi:glycosyltransferase involved in cell wall biosynthesis